MFKLYFVFVFVILNENIIKCYSDLIPEAITVYRNPEFFKNLNYGKKNNYNQKTARAPQGKNEDYKYPGEPKKPNPPPASPGFEVNYDNSPEFHHEPRDIFVDLSFKPSKRKGPYGPRSENISVESLKSKVTQPEHEEETEEENKTGSTESEDVSENKDSEEEVRNFNTALNPNPDEEYKAYHEPILLARPGFDIDENSGFASTYSKPYTYNRTTPILYEDWKYYNYPKIHSKEHLKTDSSPLYSEEPASNAFATYEPFSYFSYEDDTEDTQNFFESNENKNIGSDTKHIYKKLLKPKKSLLFRLHSKPKLKNLKLKLNKKHFHNLDWFNQYPFNF